MLRRTAMWAFALVGLSLVLAACGSSSPSSTTTSTTGIAPAAALATGKYLPPGSSGTPHYLVKITTAHGTAFSGKVKFIYQDGKSAVVFHFTGTVNGPAASATATDVASPSSATKLVTSVPDPLQIAVGSGTLTFDSCQSYLPQASSASACTFTQSH